MIQSRRGGAEQQHNPFNILRPTSKQRKRKKAGVENIKSTLTICPFFHHPFRFHVPCRQGELSSFSISGSVCSSQLLVLTSALWLTRCSREISNGHLIAFCLSVVWLGLPIENCMTVICGHVPKGHTRRSCGGRRRGHFIGWEHFGVN